MTWPTAPATVASRRPTRVECGFSLIELMTVIGIMTVMIGVAMPSITDWMENQRAKQAARSVADLFLRARSEAIRTGNRYVVFFGNPGTADPSGNPVEVSGQWVPVLLIDDGPPATADCAIAASEIVESIEPAEGMSWGAIAAGSSVATDSGAASFTPGSTWEGSTFADPTTSAMANWIVFRPDGVPVGFTGTMGGCGTIGDLGSGGGALYLTNGERDFGVVVSPLGGVRLHLWERGQGAWTG